jgi:hypothetical protein
MPTAAMERRPPDRAGWKPAVRIAAILAALIKQENRVRQSPRGGISRSSGAGQRPVACPPFLSLLPSALFISSAAITWINSDAVAPKGILQHACIGQNGGVRQQAADNISRE